jgi:hypothetical protein
MHGSRRARSPLLMFLTTLATRESCWSVIFPVRQPAWTTHLGTSMLFLASPSPASMTNVGPYRLSILPGGNFMLRGDTSTSRVRTMYRSSCCSGLNNPKTGLLIPMCSVIRAGTCIHLLAFHLTRPFGTRLWHADDLTCVFRLSPFLLVRDSCRPLQTVHGIY